jgi:hypothetical protein
VVIGSIGSWSRESCITESSLYYRICITSGVVLQFCHEHCITNKDE